MKILIDTHYLLWAFIDTGKIKKRIFEILLNEENEVYYSQASLWEISIKYNLGKLVLNNMQPEDFYTEIHNSFLQCKNLENEELISFHTLPIEHRDPFDRMMIWQCIQSDYYFLSVDSETEKYMKYGLKILA
ncbi:type II toxin-antitoxin system VapC family toxin [Treponema sp.]